MERMARKKDKALQQVFEAQKRVRGDDSNQQKRGWSRGVAADVIDLELNRAVLDQDQAEAAPSPDQPIVNSGAMMAAVIEWLKTPDQDKIAAAVANNADNVVALELAKMGINSTAELYKVMGVNQPSVPDEPVAIMESTAKGMNAFEIIWRQRVESANARAAVAQREEMRIREQLQGANRPDELENNYRDQMDKEIAVVLNELSRQYQNGSITLVQFFDIANREREARNERYRRESEKFRQLITSVAKPFIPNQKSPWWLTLGAEYQRATATETAIKNLNPPENILYPPGANSMQRYLDAKKGRIAAAIEATGAADRAEAKQPAIEEGLGLPPGAAYAINTKVMQEYVRLQMVPAGYFVNRADLIQESSSSTPRQELSEWRQTDGFKTMPAILRDLLEKAVREWTTPSQQEFDSVERMVEIECV